EEVRSVFPEAVEAGENGALKVTLPKSYCAEPGRVLCIWDDAGWGAEVKHGKYDTGVFADSLVDGAAALIRDRWKPAPPPTWVTSVPSLHRPELVRHFAERLAWKLGLPFALVLRKTRKTSPQKQMQNSVQQVRNLLGAFALDENIPSGPVLLVDDMVDSGW